jgi:hypothetical protein
MITVSIRAGGDEELRWSTQRSNIQVPISSRMMIPDAPAKGAPYIGEVIIR